MKSTTWIKDGCDFRASDEQQAQMNFKKKNKGPIFMQMLDNKGCEKKATGK